MDYYNNKTVLITGAASGFGRQLAEQLLAQGAIVALSDVQQSDCEKVINEFGHLGKNAQAFSLNVTQPEQFTEVIDQIIEKHGRLDLMINNAGIAVSGEFKDINASAWRRITDINFLGMVFGSQAAQKQMSKQGSGQIVNVASMYGLVNSPMVSAYVATKHAVVGFTQALREEAREDGIKVNVVCPGYIATDLFKNGVFEGLSQQDTMNLLPFPLMPVDKAARKCLKGMSKNVGVITFPGYVKPYWWLARMSNAILLPGHRFFLNRFRKKKASA